MSHQAVSIRTLIPLATLTLFLVISLSSSLNQYRLLKDQLQQEAPVAVRSTLLTTQRHLQDRLAINDPRGIAAEVADLGGLREVEEAVLINKDGIVVASSFPHSDGKLARDYVPLFNEEIMQQVKETARPHVFSATDTELHIYYPVLAEPPHVLFVRWNLQQQVDRLVNSLIVNLVLFWLVGGVLVVGLVWLLQRVVTQPLKHLEQKVASLNAGEGDEPFEDCTRIKEIHSLAHTMSVMHQRLQKSYLELKAGETRYRHLLDMVQEGIWVVDDRGYTTMVNQSMAKMLECSVEQMIGKHLHHFMDEAGKRISDQNMNLRIKGVLAKHDFEFITQTGRRIYTTVQASALFDAEGLFLGAIAGVMDVTERREAEQTIKRQANFDPLTNLPNRRYMTEILEREMARAKRHSHNGAVLFIDLDHFKNINDTLGHPIGDGLLVQIAHRLQRPLRPEDTLARLGGDEFVILLPELHHDADVTLTSARAIAQKLQSAVSDGYEVEGNRLTITCSIGIAVYPQDQETIHDIVRQADTAMYRSKQDGRNTIRFFTSELQQEVERNLRLQMLMPKALEEEQFELYFQPQLDHHQQLIGAEALLRWQHPERGYISPLHFIRVAEESGLIHPLGDWIIRKVCNVLKKWQRYGLPASFERVAINISPRQFVVEDFAKRVCTLVADAGVNPSWIELEITEGMLMSNLDTTIAKMHELKQHGFYLSIDDFGTGYSCLSYLKSLPISKLKIDQSFTRDLSSDKNDRSIVQTIIMMAQTLELDVLAEGVETREQFEFLDAHGCHKYQGYYFGKPVPVNEFFTKWIAPAHIENEVNRA